MTNTAFSDSVFDGLFRSEGPLYFKKENEAIVVCDFRNIDMMRLFKERVVGAGAYKTATLFKTERGDHVVFCERVCEDDLVTCAFEREGMISRQLIDEGIPNILNIKTVRSVQTGTPMTVSPWCGRGTLQNIIEAECDVEPRLKMSMPALIAMADTLKDMHAHGWCYLDFKPGNVFVTGTSTMCSRLGDLTSVTRTGEYAVAGTMYYEAPERIKAGMCARAEPTDDVFSFGVSLYEVVYGLKCLFLGGREDKSLLFDVLGEGEAEQLNSRTVEKRQRKLRTKGQKKGVQPFYGIVADCISFDPAKRPSMSEVHERVQAAWSNYTSVINVLTRRLGALRLRARVTDIWARVTDIWEE